MALDGAGGLSETFKKVIRWYPDIPPAIETPVHVLIHKQALQNSTSQAICSWDGTLTYAELANLSSHLAKYLITKGIVPEVIVPICFEKSLWAIVSALAVLKAGGAFLLLDPSQPIARLRSIVQQTGARFALSSTSCYETSKNLVEETFVVDSTTLDELDSPLSSTEVQPRNTAYIIFTSGSTGTPKGVIIEHSQLSTTATYVGERLGYSTSSRVFQFASYAFDACITDIFATLVHGGTICIPSDWDRNNGIVDAMRRMKVSSAKFTPSLVDNLVVENIPTLTTLVLGGESPSKALVQKWSQKVKLMLVYGPSECCVICFVTNASDHAIAPGEIGRPSGARGWIVKQGDSNELAEIGEVGELLIEGPQVGRGYLNDKAKTEVQFISSPRWMPTDWRQKEARLYKTGDLARYLEDGTVCYVGRVDNQVKIRGQRLELEEVEKALYTYLVSKTDATVRNIVVDAVIFSGLTSKQLVAFLHLQSPKSFGHLHWGQDNNPHFETSNSEQERFAKLVAAVEDVLKQILPIYAIPTIWIPLISVPFTVSRKKDRKLLRSIVAPLTVKQLSIFTTPAKSNTTTSSHVPMTENESTFQKLWAAVFRVQPTTIDRDDNFFSLGGDSVMAIKLIAAARKCGLDLSLDIVFRSPILHDMAYVTQPLVLRDEESEAVPAFSLLNRSWDLDQVLAEAARRCHVDTSIIEDIYPCSPMSEGLIALSLKDPGTYVLQFVYQMPQSVDIGRLNRAWEEVAKHTQLLRTRFFDYDSELLQIVIDESLIWNISDSDLVTYLAAEKARRVELGERMSRLVVVNNSESKDKFLVWTIHHALVDGWSESDVISMVEDAYLGRQNNISNTPKFSSFIKHIKQQDLKSARRFWQEQLDGSPAPVFPPLPDPTYIPKVQRSNRILHHMDEHADAELEHRIPIFKRGSATPATMIQAAWFILVGLYSNSSDVITGVTLNGRTARIPGIESITGPTVTTIPFRARFFPNETITTFLENIQSQYLDILPFAQFGLQNIRRLSDDAVNACKFQSLLVVQSANKPQSERQVLLGRSYSFPVMDFAIVMECELLEGSVDFRATFDHAVLSEERVRIMFQQMESILHMISTSGPNTKISEIQIVSEQEKEEIAAWTSQAQAVAPVAKVRRSSEPPSTDMEERLYQLWKALLDTSDFGIEDNFFQLGGGSILAMRLVSKARSQGLILTVAEVFQQPTLRTMALVMREDVQSEEVPAFSLVRQFDVEALSKAAASQCGIGIEDIEDVYPCSVMQLHYVTGYPEAENDIHGPWYWQSQAVYSLPDTIDIEKLRNTWDILVKRHQPLRTRSIYVSGKILQAVIKDSIPITWNHSTSLDGYISQDKLSHMKFGDPLLRLAIIHESESNKRYFVMTAHHIIYDAFSRNMLFQELERGYLTNFFSVLQAKMNKFIKYITETDPSSAIDFWSRYLLGAETKPLLQLPLKHPKFIITEKSIMIPRPVAIGTECTPPTLIEVTGSLVLAHHLGADCKDIVLYSDRSGRNLLVDGIQDLIGPTTLFHPVRTHINPSQTISSLLKGSQKAQTEMIPHEHVGWLELRELPGFEELKRNVVNMNINPNPLQGVLDMEFLESSAECDDPFGINVDLFDEEMKWMVYFDERFISQKVVGELLKNFERCFGVLSNRNRQSDLTVGDVLGLLGG